MNSIIFQNKGFPCRELNLKGFGNVLISTNSLNSILMNEEGGYTSLGAQYIDEDFFYFVDDKEIVFPKTKLSKIILGQL
jgi:hypothetical protein